MPGGFMARRVTLLLLVAFCILATAASATNHQVSIVDFAFQPNTLTIDFGDSVTWTNNGTAIHTTTSNAGVWNSGDMAHLATYSFRFDTSGTFAYHCIHHPSMTGTITVNTAPFDIRVDIKDNFYTPQVIQINPGQSVGWVNEGAHTHTTTADDGTWNSDSLLPTQFFIFTFPNEGVHRYHCLIHGQVMNGTIVVGKPDSVAFDLSIIDFAFVPAETTISIGQNIRWINFGAMQHTTTDTSAHHWDSDTLNPGNTFTLHGDSAGVYHYVCLFHPGIMFGSLTVRDTSTFPAVCAYRPGDVNHNGSVNGVDIVYAVNYLKGTGAPPPMDCGTPVGNCPEVSPFYAAADVNGNCAFNGIDITFFVRYLKLQVPNLLACPDCLPAP
jgi:plastocyanin